MQSLIFILIGFLTAGIGFGLFLFFFLTRKIDRGQTDAIKDLERRLTDLMIGQLKEVRDSQIGGSRALYQQISSFTKEAVQIREDLRQVQERIKDVSSFQDIFKSPKLRGQWGEASLEHILSQHFPQELYKIQHLFSSGEQVDAVLRLPNGRLLPIDAKFPTENFGKMIEAGPEEREYFQKKFIEDVKTRITEIASRYILPAESTVDFALMYVPAEAVYYEMVNNVSKEIDLTSYSWSKKVILTSPNTIYLTLRTIEHWFRDTQISRETQEILKRLNKINQDAGKLMNDFRKLGGHLRNAVSAYDSSEKRLSLFSERVEKLLEAKESPKKLK
jgi:DNA recombination protein RmuC